MAGIGFAINQVMKEKKFTSKVRAYLYGTAVTVGPMLLGELVLLSLYLLSHFIRISIFERNLMISLIAYSMLFSLIWSSGFSLLVSRYLSDCLHERRLDRVLSTFWGSNLLMVVGGGLLYSIFLVFSGVGFVNAFLTLVLFCEFVLSWNLISFLAAIKDYLSIFRAFIIAIVGTILSGFLFLFIGIPKVIGLTGAMAMGYAMFILLGTAVLYQQFPTRVKLSDFFGFVTYMDQYWKLVAIGFFMQLGLVSHVVMMWYGPIGIKVQGLFHVAPQYDITVLLAFITALVTPINFTISFEVRFLEVYRQFFQLFDAGGSLSQLQEAEEAMIRRLRRELKRIAWIQLVVTLVVISAGMLVINNLPLGFTETMTNLFRILCVAYALYAIANSVMLTLIYFAELDGAYRSCLVFGTSATLATLVSLFLDQSLFGFGFLFGAVLYFLTALYFLEKLINHLLFQVLGKQPIWIVNPNSTYYQLSKKLERKVWKLALRLNIIKKGSEANEQQK